MFRTYYVTPHSRRDMVSIQPFFSITLNPSVSSRIVYFSEEFRRASSEFWSSKCFKKKDFLVLTVSIQ